MFWDSCPSGICTFTALELVFPSCEFPNKGNPPCSGLRPAFLLQKSSERESAEARASCPVTSSTSDGHLLPNPERVPSAQPQPARGSTCRNAAAGAAQGRLEHLRWLGVHILRCLWLCVCPLISTLLPTIVHVVETLGDFLRLSAMRMYR